LRCKLRRPENSRSFFILSNGGDFGPCSFPKSDALKKYPGSSGRGQIAGTGNRIFFVSRLKDLSVRRKQNLFVSSLQNLSVSRLQNALAAVNKNAP